MNSSKIKYLYLTVILFVGSVTLALAQQVEVLDFHLAHRCVTCKTIERCAKEVVEQEFATEFKLGKIVFKTVDVEDPKNKKLAEQFEATGTALWISAPAKKIKVDLTEAGFMYAKSNPDELKKRISAEIRKVL